MRPEGRRAPSGVGVSWSPRVDDVADYTYFGGVQQGTCTVSAGIGEKVHQGCRHMASTRQTFCARVR